MIAPQTRVALVTGGSAGLGLASAHALASRGVRVVLSSRSAERLEEAAGELTTALEGAEAETLPVDTIPADVRDADDLERLVKAVEDRWGSLDVLVANGGGPPFKPALETTDEDWENAFRLAFLFVPRLCRLVIPGMRERGWGRIVAINSVTARQPMAGLSLSNAMRPAVLGYLKTLSREVAADGITVNAVLPGFTKTARMGELLGAEAERSGRPESELELERAGDVPMGRMARPDELGATVAFLASEEASYITGQALAIDGGAIQGLF